MASSGELLNPRFVGDPTLEQVIRGQATLDIGSSGGAVRRVQLALQAMGFSVRDFVDRVGRKNLGAAGVFGEQTTCALVNFQRHASHHFATVRPLGLLDATTMHARDALRGRGHPCGRRSCPHPSSRVSLHGTDSPAEIGRDVARGSVHHYDEDITIMFYLLSVGDDVALVPSADDPRLTP